jgi:hypothetical protein
MDNKKDRSRESHMDINSEEQEASKDVGLGPSVSVEHPSDY